MKVFVASCLLLVQVGVSRALHEEVIKAKWATYKAQHGKEYHPTEESARLQNYLDTTLAIERHNERFHRGEVGYELGHNHVSDMTHEEVKTKMLGKRSMNLEGRNFTDVEPSIMPSMPRHVDWRERNIVTPAKNQGQCGSCYSFGTVGVIESAIIQKTRQPVDLSEQQIVDCSFHFHRNMNGGCAGGHEVVVMDYVRRNGLLSESLYQYISGRTQRRNTCQSSSGNFGKNLRYHRVPPGNEDGMAEAVATYGTLVVSISGENRQFQFLRGGIFDNPSCPKSVDHVVSIVGYGEDGGRKYWIVKNSWGRSWGENGFGKVARGVNQCGIASDNAWAITV